MTLKEKWNQKPEVIPREGYVAFPMVCSRLKAEVIGSIGGPIAAVFFALALFRIPLSMIKGCMIDLFNMTVDVGEVFIRTRTSLQQRSYHPASNASLFSLFIASAAAALLILATVLYIQLVIHEWLHAIGWTIGTKTKAKECDVRINKACCHCSEDMSVGRSIFGTMLPAIILGIIPVIISMIVVSPILLILGILGIIEAGMDILHSIQLMKYLRYKGAVCTDDPEFIGGIVYVPENEIAKEVEISD